MTLIIDQILIDNDGLFLGCIVHAQEDVYVIMEEEDKEYLAGESFVLSQEDLWYNKEDGLDYCTRTERVVDVVEEETVNNVGIAIKRYFLRFERAKTPLHKRQSIKDIEIIVANGDTLTGKDLYYLITSYCKKNYYGLEVL